ncbi:lysylphosphatidylglycerol synthase domain-containing protein [Aurantibacter sp.]|uniref:lysylphosphatidylglycerol synthase domain-containing protein n=1 Tax=Aurantibacter sp. TaxID=2807103 RepID=UPI0035C7F7F2
MFGAFYIIYLKCFESISLSWSLFIDVLINSKVLKISSAIILIIMSILNWWLEIIKWQLLVKSIRSISFFEAFKQSTSSLTASLITPNRIGEYGAKALYYSKYEAKNIVTSNLIGNLSQLFWTLIFGTCGLIYLFNTYSFNLPVSTNNIFVSVLIGLCFFCAIFWIYKKFNFNINELKISKTAVFKVILLSLLRYIVFSFQFYAILRFFNIELSFIEALAFISSTYILASVVPIISLFDVVIKGSIAVFLFDLAGINSILILSTVLTMWLLNFAIPAIIGSYYVINYSSKSVLV